MIRLEDLHESYAAATIEERIQMANLGAICWNSLKQELYDQWSASLSVDESQKAEMWRSEGIKEGKQMMFESVKAKLASADALSIRVATAEATIQHLRESIDMEAMRRMTDMKESLRKDFELEKKDELSKLQESLAAAKARVEYISKLEDLVSEKAITIQTLTNDTNSLRTKIQQLEQEPTKSSHQIGKKGESTILGMIENTVIPAFPYSSVVNVAKEYHVGDFHLFIMTPDGKKVKILIDSKNYTQPVETIEVKKLNSDVDADDHAHAGLMISLESNIQKKKQFEISRTSRQRPVMFLSFRHMDTDSRNNVLCWAVRVLQMIGAEQNMDDRQKMIVHIEELLNNLDGSVKELDIIIRNQIKIVASMKKAKFNLLHTITSFREGTETTEDTVDMMDTTDVPEQIGSQPEPDGSCPALLKKNNDRCSRPVVLGSSYCKLHSKKKIGICE
jgi:hypothetical protein